MIDVNLKIISNIVIPVAGIFLTLIGGVVGYFFGIIKEKYSIKWKENREALQCAYAYFDMLYFRLEAKMPFTDLLWRQLEDLKYKKNFNILNKKIHKEVRRLMKIPLYDISTKTYNMDIYDEAMQSMKVLLEKIKKELE